ncbi:hypothetical protein [Mycobacterium paraffinicum]|uniref:hypothetical protein n=1 Tax=Mycobacterium paraffinicum TaxID=53378 RepID=UPI0021F26166|nr:hypothetical protein [Mycobacterium paraffinicum]MCV7311270.1 hypothetical protein [Mycobacterium paraffinicum]
MTLLNRRSGTMSTVGGGGVFGRVAGGAVSQPLSAWHDSRHVSECHEVKAEAGPLRVWGEPAVFRAISTPDTAPGVLATAGRLDTVDADLLPMLVHKDFHSAHLSDLVNIELVISSVMHVVTVVLETAFKNAGFIQHVLGGAIGEDATNELAYTDILADLPALSREYEDVDVVIVGEDEMKPRTYTDEDHQVWRT